MAKTLVVCGFGTGISRAVAEKFGKEGFTLALVGRNAERLAEGVRALESAGVSAQAFPADLSDAVQLKSMIASVREKLGPISALHWNVYSAAAGDLLTASSDEVREIFEVSVTQLLVALEAALPDLQTQQAAALLVTNGGLGLDDPQIDAMAVAWNSMGLAVANAAKHKLVGLLSRKLEPMNVYVGEVIVLGAVKGTAWDDGSAKLEASSVAAKFWELYSKRSEVSAKVG